MRTQNKSIEYFIGGKIPPQAKELEEAVLGAILIESDAIKYVADILKPEVFYVTAHVIIYDVLSTMYQKGIPIDLLTVTEEIRKIGKLEEIGGSYYLSDLTNVVSSSANIIYHSRVLYQKYIQRELIRISHDIIREAYEDTTDVFELLDLATSRILDMSNAGKTNVVSLESVISKIDSSILKGEAVAKVYSYGFAGLDTLTKTFNIIAGLQGTGKTAFALRCSRGLAEQKIRVGIISIEMSNMMLASRVLQTETSISSKTILSNSLTDSQKEHYFEHNKSEIHKYIFIDEGKGMNNRNICTRIRTLVAKYGVQVVFIDYAQLVKKIKYGNSNDVSYNEELSNDLQQLSKDLDISITALSQLQKTQGKPTINSIRGGGLEQSASDLWILHNEHWEEDEGKDWNDILEDRRGKILLIDAKGRYSAVKNRELYFDKPNQDYTDWNSKPYSSILGNFSEVKSNKTYNEMF